MIVRFTIPAKYANPSTVHPVSADLTPVDWFEVQADTRDQAQLHVGQVYGDFCWASSYITGDAVDEQAWLHRRHAGKGECKRTIDLWNMSHQDIMDAIDAGDVPEGEE